MKTFLRFGGQSSFVPVCVVTLAFALTCRAYDVSRYDVFKRISYSQTDTNLPTLKGNTPYRFDSSLDSTLPEEVTNATVKLPDNTTYTLTHQCDGWETPSGNSFSNQAALDAAFPNGNYTLTMFTVHDGTHAPVLSVTNNTYPASAPHVTNYTAAQTINPSNSFTLGWDSFPGGMTNDFIGLFVKPANGGTVFEAPFVGPGVLNGLSNSVVIPANSLPPGQTNQATLFFARGSIATNNAGYPNVVAIRGYIKVTSFNMVTTGSPDTNGPTLNQSNPTNSQIGVPLNSAIAFSFDKPMQNHGAVDWSSNVASNAFTYLWTPDRQTLVCLYSSNLPVNATISWALNTFGCDNLQDISGNQLQNFGNLSGSFTTGTNATAKDVFFYGCGKEMALSQTSTNTPTTNGFQFEALAQLQAVFSMTNATVMSPTGGVFTMSANNDNPPEFHYRQQFADMATMDATFTNGNYVMTLNCVRDGTKTATNLLTGNSYPNSPRISNYPAAQAINPNNPFTFTWDAFAGGTTNDFVQFSVQDTNGNSLFETGQPFRPGALNGTSNSIVVPAGTLVAGQNYQGQLLFAKVVTINSNSYPGVVSSTFYAKENDFNVATVLVAPTLSSPRRTSPSQFQFLLTGASAAQNYTLQASPNLAGTNNLQGNYVVTDWFNVLVTNAPSSSFTVVDPFATNLARRFYRVLVGP